MTQETATQEAEQPVTQLSIQDLYGIRSIIDVASTRGAFRANELSTVGETYNRLNAFLMAVEANAASEAEGADVADGSAEDATETEGE